MSTPNLLVIGAGNMATAIIRGAIDADLEAPDHYLLCDVDEAKLAPFREKPLADRVAATSASLAELAAKLAPDDQVMLAVKPQMLADVASELRPILDAGPRRVVISILAGTPIERLRSELGPNAAPVRVMPNLPVSIGLGMSAVAAASDASPGDDDLAAGLLGGSGEATRLDESLMDAFTALAGSGPAYLFYLAEGMINGAIDAGFERDQASTIVRQTLLGAAAMLKRDEREPETLRAAVTSKGGTTAAATSILDEAGALDAMRRAILAGRDRGRELAGG